MTSCTDVDSGIFDHLSWTLTNPSLRHYIKINLFEICKYSEFPHERFLVSRWASLVVELPHFCHQTGQLGYTQAFPPEYSEWLYCSVSVLRASPLRAGCTLSRWGWDLGSQGNRLHVLHLAMFSELTEAHFHTSLWNINHMGNEAKDNSSKDFLNVNGTRTSDEI